MGRDHEVVKKATAQPITQLLRIREHYDATISSVGLPLGLYRLTGSRGDSQDEKVSLTQETVIGVILSWRLQVGPRGPKSEEAGRLMSLSYRGASRYSVLSRPTGPTTIAGCRRGRRSRFAEGLSTTYGRWLQEVFHLPKQRTASCPRLPCQEQRNAISQEFSNNHYRKRNRPDDITLQLWLRIEKYIPRSRIDYCDRGVCFAVSPGRT